MELADVLHQMMTESAEAMQPTDLAIGTVTKADPLEITINTAMAPLRKEVLYLTASVIEWKIPTLQHLHQISSLSHEHSNSAGATTKGLESEYPTQTSLNTGTIHGYQNGAQLPIENGYIILNRALITGDKVLLLRVNHGQKFIVLSRLFE